MTMRSKQWYTKMSRLSNSFANNSIGRLLDFASSNKIIRQVAGGVKRVAPSPASADSSRVKSRPGGASLQTAGRVSPSGREGRARHSRPCCKHQPRLLKRRVAISDLDIAVFARAAISERRIPTTIQDATVYICSSGQGRIGTPVRNPDRVLAQPP